MLDKIAVKQAKIVRDKSMMTCGGGATKPLDDCAHGERIGIAGLRHDSKAAILRDWAGCPTMVDMPIPPFRCDHMVHMVAVKQRNQHVYIK